MKVSAAAIQMIKHHEGVRTKPYRCPALLWTVGVGHVIDPSHAAVKYEDRKNLPIPEGWDRILSMGEVDAILAQDLGRFERGVLRLCPAATGRQGQGDRSSQTEFSGNRHNFGRSEVSDAPC